MSAMRSQVARPRRPALLTVDDDDGVRETYVVLFGDWMDVVGAESAAAALTAARGRRFDTIILDVLMPGLSGLEILDELQQVQPRVPIIFVSAVNAVETAISAIRHGAFDYVTKPFDEDTLTSLVRRALANAVGVVSIVGRDRGFCAAVAVLAAARDGIPVVLGATPEAIRTVYPDDSLAATYAILAPGRAPLSDFVARIATYVAKHYVRVNVDTLAEALRLSPDHLSRAFRAESSLTAKGYVTRVRIEVARVLLRETRVPLETIAEEVGLCDASHLSRMFRRNTGTTPGAYRNVKPSAADGWR